MSLFDTINEQGFTILEPGLTDEDTELVLRELESFDPSVQAAGRGGIRDVLRLSPAGRRLVTHPIVRRVVEAVIGQGAFAVRGVLFDKHPGANWKVPWQDLTIAVRQVVPATGYGPWSEKAGVPHVQPPPEILAEVLTVRIHLDECDSSNGPVRVFPGSHLSGRLSDSAIAAISNSREAVTCAVRRGGLLVMRPLLIHGSSSAIAPGRRRVLHLDFAACSLAEGLEWAEQWRCAA